jgi:hypothetical protein
MLGLGYNRRMSKKPVNLTLNQRVLELAEQVMRLRGHSSLSGFVEELIRDEYDRRHGPLVFNEKPVEYKIKRGPNPRPKRFNPQEGC